MTNDFRQLISEIVSGPFEQGEDLIAIILKDFGLTSRATILLASTTYEAMDIMVEFALDADLKLFMFDFQVSDLLNRTPEIFPNFFQLV